MKQGQRYTDADLLDAVRAYAADHGGEVHGQNRYAVWAKENGRPASITIMARLAGSWQDIIERAGCRFCNTQPGADRRAMIRVQIRQRAQAEARRFVAWAEVNAPWLVVRER